MWTWSKSSALAADETTAAGKEALAALAAQGKSIYDEDGVTMVARVDSRAVVERDQVIQLAFDTQHIHMFDKETEQTLLSR